MFAIKDEDLEPLIERELASSKVQHEEKFKNAEQADEVLFEEISEADEELRLIKLCYIHSFDDDLETHAKNGIKELIQVVAMCRKWKESRV